MLTLKTLLEKIKSYLLYLHQGYMVPLERKSILQKIRSSRPVHNGSLPIPPPYLIWLVIGKPDVSLFLESGQRQVQDLMLPMLEKNQIDPQGFHELLDFGCGCGRLVRHLHFLQNCKIRGCDYNKTLIKWCTKNLGFGHFYQNNLTPPLAYQNDQFDFLYVRSIFTHLPEEIQLAWLREFIRIIRPGGYLWITLSGDFYTKYMTTEELKKFKNQELVVRHPELAGKNECAVFHPKQYVLDRWPALGLTFVDFIPGGTIDLAWQDTYLWKVE
ncbi:MAG: class I SAM-dependent methyltransferase [Saprospiraceae bacterium]|nr:class I SAM-dependent methyltransferase [Saprospiraceae bacterium]